MQLVALSMLAFAPASWLVVPYVMVAQALSGIAKDLTKMSSKSAVKLVVPEGASDTLFRWVAILTGSKNALKGVGFFLGGLLLTLIGFQSAILVLMVLVGAGLIVVLTLMRGSLGRGSAKAKFAHMFSNTRAVNVLAAARLVLFAARDVWFVVGLPVFLRTEEGWSFWQAGAFLGGWVIFYGIVQASAPSLLRRRGHGEPTGLTATWLAFVLAALTAAIAVALQSDVDPSVVVVVGLLVWGVIFALNSAVHSFLILHYAEGDRVAMNVGFYYMANAGGRLLGTVLSGLLYQWQGLTACLVASVVFLLVAGMLSLLLPREVQAAPPSVDARGASSRQPRLRAISLRLMPAAGMRALMSSSSSTIEGRGGVDARSDDLGWVGDLSTCSGRPSSVRACSVMAVRRSQLRQPGPSTLTVCTMSPFTR